MPRFRNKDLAELAHQLTLSPKRKRLEQVRGIERLLASINSEKAYPYDLVCFNITGYRNRRTADKCLIPGDALVSDLVTMAEQVTRRCAIPLADLGDGHKTHEEVAAEFSVSTKTIRRWRRRGLMGIRAMFDDGVSRLVYLPDTIKRFSEQHKDLVERGANFKQLTSAEKKKIIDMARRIVTRRRTKLHVAAREIAEQTGRAVETIRYTLRRYDEAHRDDALFAGDDLMNAPKRERILWKAVSDGQSVSAVAEAYSCTTLHVEQVMRRMQARLLKVEPPVCVFNELFDAPNADALILDAPRPPSATTTKKVRAPKELPAYLRSLYDIPLMTGDQETDAFRRYNYIKHKAARLIEAVDVESVTQGDLDAVGDLIARSEELRKEIVKANLRLVVSIAKRHVGWSANFFEVVSDGNMSLLRAVEKFDYARGFKFSTYASWAVIKNYARTIPESHYHLTRYVTGQDELLDRAADEYTEPGGNLDERTLSDVLEEGMSDLTDRERRVVTAHFGLFGAKSPLTLEQLGDEYGVTKERIRQIERRAIDKIKAALSPSMADMVSA